MIPEKYPHLPVTHEEGEVKPWEGPTFRRQAEDSRMEHPTLGENPRPHIIPEAKGEGTVNLCEYV